MGLITGNLQGASSMDFATQVSRVIMISRGHNPGHCIICGHTQ